MLRKFLSLLLLAASLMGLTGCSSVYEKEYVHISEYSLNEPLNPIVSDRVEVRNFAALKQAILGIVYSEDGSGTIAFDPAYEGDAVEDMASACWQVRTQDAMCAYCVENIAYEMNKIVSYYEAALSVTYSSNIKEAGGLVRMQYATSLDDQLNKALSQGRNKLALLIGRSTYTAEDMKSVVEKLYRSNPTLAPQMPVADVNLFSGNMMQRLYEINLDYGMNGYELRKRRDAVLSVQPFVYMELGHISAEEKISMACDYLTENCVYSPESGLNSIYSAFVLKEADSEGISYAFVELCRQLGINSRMIYGQYNWQDHWWNLVEIDGQYYHVDASLCLSGDMDHGFLLNDQTIWETHRWDTSSYPACSGELINGDVNEEDPHNSDEESSVS